MTPGPDDPIVRAAQVLSRELDDGLVLYHPLTDGVTHLDHIARMVWEQLDQKPTEDELVARLTGQFQADQATVRRDISQLLAELRAAQLVAATQDAGE